MSVPSQPSESLSRIPEVHFSRPFRRGLPSTVVIHGAAHRTRDHHRRQPGRFVRRACAVGFPRAGHRLRARQSARRPGEPGRSAPGQARPLADGARRPGIRDALPRSARRHGCRRGADSGEPTGLYSLRRGRPHLEWQIRRRVTAIDNVEFVRAAVSEPRYEPGRQQVTGVVLDSGDPVGADLVVDATGRGTRLPVWLAQWGFERPREDRVDVGIAYATHQLRIPDGLIAEKVVVAGASRKQLVGLGMLYYEDGTWGLTTFGVGKVEPPHDFAGMCALADEILPGHVAAAIRHGEPIGEVAFHKFPTSRWRRYDKLDRFPAGIIPFGDAVVSFNPTFGQGMTMMSLQTGHLRRVLETPGADLARDFNRAAAKTTYPVWTMNAIGDLVLHRATGPMPWWYRPVGNLFDQFLGAAETDPVLAEWFLRRFSLLDSLYMVPSARLVGRTIRHNVRLWLAERRASRSVPDRDLVAGAQPG